MPTEGRARHISQHADYQWVIKISVPDPAFKEAAWHILIHNYIIINTLENRACQPPKYQL
jgi:hypothetical protein